MPDVNDDQNKNNIPPNIKSEQLINYVEKVWGHEEWIVNNLKYCGKKLVVKKGYRISMHYHKMKDETFYVLSGKILAETEFEGKKESRLMTPGDILHIKPYVWHRITGIADSEIIEFSTFHMDEDSYRKTKSEAVDLRELGF